MIHKEAVCRTIHQYNKEPVSDEDMGKLREIAKDYRQVKNYVYTRYGGIGSLPKLYPGYTIQNEMTQSGLRAELAMPSVYFYRAVFDALGDIKSQWSRTKSRILKLTGQNQNLTAEEKHYIRFLLKSKNAFEAVLNGSEIDLPHEMQLKYDILAESVDAEKLQRYLRRQVRKYHVRYQNTESEQGFSITERAYRYGRNAGSREKYGIYIATKENRKRIFIPLTDENAYKKQLYIRLKPDENGIEIDIPIETRVRVHKDYTNEIGLSAGIWCMFTTDEGSTYGGQFGELHKELAEYMYAAGQTYRREKANNAGRRKYRARKAKLDAKLETYVNQEINRMLLTEKPKVIYIPKLPGNSLARHDRKINYSVSVWRKGYIRERLNQKCRENSVEIVEVMGKAVSTECSRCGAQGKYGKNVFWCADCGYETDKKINAARNALKRGRAGQKINAVYMKDEETVQ